MPPLCGLAGSQGVRDVSRLALLKSHQGTSHDTGIQGAAHLPPDFGADSADLSRLGTWTVQLALELLGQGDQVLT